MVSLFDYGLYERHDERAMETFGSLGLSLPEIVKKYNASEEMEWGEKLIRYSGQQQARFLCGYSVV